jgi:hypothetical protein
MDNITLMSILGTHDVQTAPYFRGVYPMDVFLRQETLDNIDWTSKNAFVINTDTSDLPGNHWIALYIVGYELSNNISIVFFDSFGENPEEYSQELSDYIYSLATFSNDGLKCAPFRIQGAESRLCGAYCVFVLHYLVQDQFNANLDVIIPKYFSPTDLCQNDSVVTHWAKKSPFKSLLYNYCHENSCVSFEKLHGINF